MTASKTSSVRWPKLGCDLWSWAMVEIGSGTCASSGFASPNAKSEEALAPMAAAERFSMSMVEDLCSWRVLRADSRAFAEGAREGRGRANECAQEYISGV